MKDDTISRQAAIEALHMHLMYRVGTDSNKKRLDDWINSLPSAQPDLNEWCTDCKEYDSEKHHCPRYNRVIREALNGAEPRKPGEGGVSSERICLNVPVVGLCTQRNS